MSDLMKQYGKVVKVVETTTREFFFDAALAAASHSPKGKATATEAPKGEKGSGVTIGKGPKVKNTLAGKVKTPAKPSAKTKAVPASSPDNAGQKEGFKKFGKPAWKWASFVCYSIASMQEAGKAVDEIVAFINENLAKAEAKYGEAYAKVMAAKIESNPKYLALTIEQEA